MLSLRFIAKVSRLDLLTSVPDEQDQRNKLIRLPKRRAGDEFFGGTSGVSENF